ncbi:hypothetical protein LC608_13165 [Nostoc sp. XA010]|uniref:hypothetical protein n=1 Tax=Nostoc sp. XA010 TaxID=2780407 RepID=UPI001E5DA076|nr:hypothetical protein [Nostoc sp. XA010]MCC5657921.1 hypothetical protein [Nostoc sp. XA010]
MSTTGYACTSSVRTMETEKMCLKSLLIELLTSMDYYLFEPPSKTEMLPTTGGMRSLYNVIIK